MNLWLARVCVCVAVADIVAGAATHNWWGLVIAGVNAVIAELNYRAATREKRARVTR